MVFAIKVEPPRTFRAMHVPSFATKFAIVKFSDSCKRTLKEFAASVLLLSILISRRRCGTVYKFFLPLFDSHEKRDPLQYPIRMRR